MNVRTLNIRARLARQVGWTAGIAFCCSTAWFALLPASQEQATPQATPSADPRQWITRTFPLLDDIRDQSLLRHGNWLVLLSDRRCAGCAFLADDFIEAAENLVSDRSSDALRFCILEYGPQPDRRPQIRQVSTQPRVQRLSVAASSRLLPDSRGILHLRDSRVVQFYAPSELDLVLKVFGS